MLSNVNRQVLSVVSKYYLVLTYLGAIVAANVLVAAFGPRMSIINAFVFIGFDITSRDKLHELWHGAGLKRKMAALILAGSVLSWLADGAAGKIAFASFVSFMVSATLDTVVYSLLAKYTRSVRINGSNIISSAADSVIFPGLAFGFPLLWSIALAQFIAKLVGGFAWSWILDKDQSAR